ncbi:hypothetical protein LINPERPRIM_LOCUS33802 [Linum perenne]
MTKTTSKPSLVVLGSFSIITLSCNNGIPRSEFQALSHRKWLSGSDSRTCRSSSTIRKS